MRQPVLTCFISATCTMRDSTRKLCFGSCCKLFEAGKPSKSRIKSRLLSRLKRPMLATPCATYSLRLIATSSRSLNPTKDVLPSTRRRPSRTLPKLQASSPQPSSECLAVTAPRPPVPVLALRMQVIVKINDIKVPMLRYPQPPLSMKLLMFKRIKYGNTSFFASIMVMRKNCETKCPCLSSCPAHRSCQYESPKERNICI